MITAPTRHSKTFGLGALRCRILKRFSELESLAGQWERLWSSDPGKEIFQHFGWVRAWMRAFAKDHRLFTAVVYDDEEVIAILPLVECGQALRFIGYSTSDYNALLCVPEFAAEALALALDTLFAARPRQWKKIVLENVREDARLSEAVAQLPDRWRRFIQISGPTACPTLILGAGKEQLLARILSKDKVKKTSKTILRLGDTSFRHLDSAAEIRAHLPHFAEQHISRCVLDGRPSQFLRKHYSFFYEYLTEEFDPASQIRFSLLEISGKPAAYHFGFELDGKYLFYKPVFDVDLWDYSPGQVLLFKLFEYFRHSDVREFDLGQGGEPYKSRYANACRENRTFTVYPPNLSGQVMRACGHVAMAARRRARVAIDRYPTLQAIGDRFEAAAARWRQQGLFERAESRVYPLPDALGLEGELGLQPVNLSTLAKHAAHNPGFLTAGELHDIRHCLKKGCTAYADTECRCVVLASRGAVAETAAGPVDSGGLGLVFTVLREAPGNRPALIQAMAEIAARKGMMGWFVCGRSERVLKSLTVSEPSGGVG
jgi:CelD/BcsL family acetyltransferase involved in cellulose biosynthesis